MPHAVAERAQHDPVAVDEVGMVVAETPHEGTPATLKPDEWRGGSHYRLPFLSTPPGIASPLPRVPTCCAITTLATARPMAMA